MAAHSWQYAYLFPYSHPMLAIKAMEEGMKSSHGDGALPQITIDLFTKEIFVSLAIAVVIFAAGYFIVLKKSVK